MIYVLSIGSRQYAFKSNRGLSTVIETMSKAREIAYENHVYPGLVPTRDIKLRPEAVECTLQVLSGHKFTKSRRDVIDPEVLPAERRPDAGPNYRALDMIRQPALKWQAPRMIGEGMQ